MNAFHDQNHGRDENYKNMEQRYSEMLELWENHEAEVEKLRNQLRMSDELNGQVIAKLRSDMEDRPFLVDKRLCVQMLTQYFAASVNTKTEILNRMADSLGFSGEEREMLGLKKSLLGLNKRDGNFGEAFVDFLQEESL